MKLYTYDPAPNPRRLTLFLKLKGIEIETHQVDMMTADQLSDDYRKINPACTVPALVTDDGTVLTEVIGIYVYLEALYPEHPLLGSTALERAQTISGCHHVFCGLMMSIASALRNRGKGFINRALPGPVDVPQIPDLVDRGILLINHILPRLDDHLSNSTWMAGDNFTVADIDLLVSIEFLSWIKQSIPDECSHLKAWYGRATAQVA